MKKLLVICSMYFAHIVPAMADVTMNQDMEPYRVDELVGFWSGGVFDSITMTVVVTGKNENVLDVGYLEENVPVDAEDWAQAVNAYAALPDPGAVGVKLAAAGLLVDEVSGLYLPWLDVSGTDPRDELEMADDVMDWNLLRLEQGANWDVYETIYVVQDVGLDESNCSHLAIAYDTTALTPLAEGATYSDLNAYFSARDAGDAVIFEINDAVDTGCSGSYTLTESGISLDGEDLAAFLPIGVGSDPVVNALPGPVTPFNQNERSAVALLTDAAAQVAIEATSFYETDAYAGYPAFSLFYGYFAGTPDPPVDEGDCEGDFCEGDGDGGSGGDGGDVSELTDLLRNAVGGGIDELGFDGQSMSEEILEGLEGVPCYGCEFISEGNGWENTEVAETASTLGDDFFAIFPDAGTCEVITVNLIPSKGFSFSINTCNLNAVKLILTFIVYGATVLACIYIVLPKKVSGGTN